MINSYLIIDFDSTLVNCESLDKLAEISLRTKDNSELIVAEIQRITELGMEGKLDFGESLERRIKLFTPTLRDINELTEYLSENMSLSVSRNRDFFLYNADRIYIISGGFKEFISPIAKKLGIKEDHILANEFLWKDGYCVGFDQNNMLSKKGGKVKAVSSLNLKGHIVIVGDGFTDFEVKKSGAADLFYAFVENVKRDLVVENADFAAKDFDQVIAVIH